MIPAVLLSPLLSVLACGGAKEADTGDTGAAVSDDTGDTAGETGDTAGETGDTDTGETGDTGGTLESGLLTWNGVATADGSYVGIEQVLLLGNNGLGETACQIDYDIVSTGARTDCSECLWAYDVRLGPATVVVPDHCVEAGYDEATIAAIEGTTRAYGLALDFMGHGNTLMLLDGERWTAVALVDWDDATGGVNYEWAQGYVEF